MLFQKFPWYNFPCCIIISEFIETYIETFVILFWLLHFPKVWNSLILIVWFWFILKPHFLGWAGKQGVWTQKWMFISGSAVHTQVVQQFCLILSQLWELFLGKSCYLGPKPWEYSSGTWDLPRTIVWSGSLVWDHQQGYLYFLDPSQVLYESKWHDVWSKGHDGAVLRWM